MRILKSATDKSLAHVQEAWGKGLRGEIGYGSGPSPPILPPLPGLIHHHRPSFPSQKHPLLASVLLSPLPLRHLVPYSPAPVAVALVPAPVGWHRPSCDTLYLRRATNTLYGITVLLSNQYCNSCINVSYKRICTAQSTPNFQSFKQELNWTTAKVIILKPEFVWSVSLLGGEEQSCYVFI